MHIKLKSHLSYCSDEAEWDSAKGKCQYKCGSIENGVSGSTPNDDGSCQCSPTYVWSGSACEKFNCSTISYVNHTAAQTQEGDQICVCQTNFGWD